MDLVALLLTVIAIIVALYIFRRVLIFVALIILIGVIGYFVYQDKGGDINLDKPKKNVIRYTNKNVQSSNAYLTKFKDNFCGMLYDRDDSLKCYIIAEPIVNQIEKDYSAEELTKMNKQEFIKAVLKAAGEQKDTIIARLKEKNAIYLWGDFKEDLKSIQF